jgi:hypothetical protein
MAVNDGCPKGRYESDRLEFAEGRVPVQPEIVEDLFADDPGADNVGTDSILFLENPDVDPGLRQAGGQTKSARSSPDDKNVRSFHNDLI